MKNVTGVILAGGRSKRFGRNKALEIFKDERLIDRGIRLLKEFFREILVITNEVDSYIGIDATIVKDIIPFFGPLGGIYTALLFSVNDWIFVRAVDMPFLSHDLVNIMLRYSGENFDVIVPLSEKGYEPLCAMYNRRCVSFIAKCIEKDDRRIVSFFNRVKVKKIDAGDWRTVDPDGLSFVNINTLEEFSKISSGFLAGS